MSGTDTASGHAARIQAHEGSKQGEKECSSNLNLKKEDKESFEFFYSKKSPFSQHFPVSFQIDGVMYNCAEQYMMHQKAGMSTVDHILGRITVYVHQMLGRITVYVIC